LTLPQWSERSCAGLISIAPDVIAGEADVFRAERRDVAEEIIVDRPSLAAQLPVGGPQVFRVPEEAALDAALTAGGWEKVTRLHRTDDIPQEQCWLRAPGWVSERQFLLRFKMAYTQSTFV